MIDVKDLMMGDLVLVHETGWNSDGSRWEADKIMAVNGMDEWHVGVIDADGDGWYEAFENISPITLTHKILEDSGFLFNFEDGDYAVGELSLTMDDDMSFMVNTTTIGLTGLVYSAFAKIHYVHELQHLLRIMNMNKLINIRL